MTSRIIALLLFVLTCAVPGIATADVEVSRVGPIAVQTGSWTAHLIRRDTTMRCPLGTATDCYFAYIDLRNASDQVLDCRAQVNYDNGGSFLASSSGSAAVSPRSAYPIVVLNAGARMNAYLQYTVNCTARPAAGTPPPGAPPAGDVQFEGNSSYSFSADRRQLTVQADRVANRRASGTSGTLTIEVWLTAQRGGSQGTKIADVGLGTLQGGFGVSVNRTVAVTPPTGTHYVVYLLKEFGGGTLDRVDFSNPITIGTAPPPTQPGPPSSADVEFYGASSYDFSADRTWLTVGSDRIQNSRSSGVSGALTIEVWLTEQKGASQGYKIGEVSLGTLQAGTGMAVSRTIDVTPRAGTFYVTYLLIEAGAGTRDRVDFDQPVTFSTTSSPPPAQPGATPDTGGNGGGGSMDAVTVAVLGLLGLVGLRRRQQPVRAID